MSPRKERIKKQDLLMIQQRELYSVEKQLFTSCSIILKNSFLLQPVAYKCPPKLPYHAGALAKSQLLISHPR